MEKLKGIKEIKGPVWIVGIGALLSIAFLILGIVKRNEPIGQLKGHLSGMLVIIIGALIMMRAVHCLHTGNCNILAWIVAIFIALLYVLPTGVVGILSPVVQDKLVQNVKKVMGIVPKV
jgi:hypothetical protein